MGAAEGFGVGELDGGVDGWLTGRLMRLAIEIWLERTVVAGYRC